MVSATVVAVPIALVTNTVALFVVVSVAEQTHAAAAVAFRLITPVEAVPPVPIITLNAAVPFQLATPGLAPNPLLIVGVAFDETKWAILTLFAVSVVAFTLEEVTLAELMRVGSRILTVAPPDTNDVPAVPAVKDGPVTTTVGFAP